ncbi:hypothetical protein NUM_23670 [Actinocatenispora comari]|uniref:Secreted protein n=1 Tax=Actinocatenispora comari TaxID=2807577 RepID=A0A8J4EKQ8_9ACTN|nr:hypothetical protein NUM_23670 [Actinocatenispora comari]
MPAALARAARLAAATAAGAAAAPRRGERFGQPDPRVGGSDRGGVGVHAGGVRNRVFGHRSLPVTVVADPHIMIREIGRIADDWCRLVTDHGHCVIAGCASRRVVC